MIRNKRTTFAACIDTDSALTNRNTVPRLAGPIVDDTSPTGRAVQASRPRPATATQRRDSESPSGLRPFPLPCGNTFRTRLR